MLMRIEVFNERIDSTRLHFRIVIEKEDVPTHGVANHDIATRTESAPLALVNNTHIWESPTYKPSHVVAGTVIENNHIDRRLPILISL